MSRPQHATDVGSELIAALIRGYRADKQLAERALAQLEEADWHVALDSESNPVSVLVRHIAGNLRSRWTDFLTTDGEKPTRDRDHEFERVELSVDEMMAEWEAGYQALFDTLESLTPEDLTRTVTIRGEPHGVIQAMLRNYAHTAQHVGQIVMLAKHLAGDRWQTLSIPRQR